MIFSKKNLLVFFLSLASSLPAQTDKKASPNSPVFKSYRSPTTAPVLEQSDATYEMWQGFNLIQRANAGDAVSQFELSVRYLTGKGFKADTVKAVYWAKKAMEQNHLLARYNLAIFEFNGWGTQWDPFEAYENFKFDAEHNIPEAQYVLAQFLTENLVVPKNWDEAYRWVKLAADSGYAPALETLKEFEKRGYHPPSGSASDSAKPAAHHASAQSGAIQISFLNFAPDTVKAPSDSVLFDDAVRAAMLSKDPEIQRIFGSLNSTPSEHLEIDTAAFRLIKDAADNGSPEALSLMARCYERGVRVQRDAIMAAEYYIRAIRLDSPRSARLLFNLIQEKEFFEVLKSHVGRGNPDAEYVWACLVALGYDYQLTDVQALQMLERAVSRQHVQSMIELGLCYYSGRWTPHNEEKAETLWGQAARKGSSEAAVRLAIMKIRSPGEDYSSAVSVLGRAAAEGSVLAEFALAYCYEKGLGVEPNKAEAVRLYRSSVQRGSQDAFRALQRLHDEIRPKGKEFRVED